MPFQLTCKCGASASVPNALAGKRYRCPKCGQSGEAWPPGHKSRVDSGATTDHLEEVPLPPRPRREPERRGVYHGLDSGQTSAGTEKGAPQAQGRAFPGDRDPGVRYRRLLWRKIRSTYQKSRATDAKSASDAATC